jgi:DNA-binding transcriptional LysR family regulator
VEIEHLAAHPLLLLETSFVFRRIFDAACRLAGFEPRVAFESRTPHVLLAMAEHGHGIAIVPSALKTQRYDLRLLGVSYQGKLLSEPLAVFWNSRRPLPRYAVAFCAMLAQYVQAAFPISRPSASV